MLINTSLRKGENLQFEVVRKSLPYLESVPPRQIPRFNSIVVPNRRIPILKIQRVSIHDHQDKRAPQIYGSSFCLEPNINDLRHIEKVSFDNNDNQEDDFVSRDINRQKKTVSASPTSRERHNSAKSKRSLGRKSSLGTNRHFVSPKPPRTQPSIPRYEHRPDLNMNFQDNEVGVLPSGHQNSWMDPERGRADDDLDPVTSMRECQTAHANIKVNSSASPMFDAKEQMENLRKLKSAMMKRRTQEIVNRLQKRNGKLSADYTIGNFSSNRKLVSRDFKRERFCENNTLDEWIKIDEKKSAINQEVLESKTKRKHTTIEIQKAKLGEPKLPEDYPKLTKAAVMLSANVHLMDSYLKQMQYQ